MPGMTLPPVNQVVSLEQIREICLHFGLPALWRKIESDPPRKPFMCVG